MAISDSSIRAAVTPESHAEAERLHAGGWIPTSARLPEKGQRVDWISPGGDQVNGGTFAGGAIWFLPGDNPMYVYYRPTYWRPAVEG